jgi:tetratricopeptide (TPR) repeat protein
MTIEDARCLEAAGLVAGAEELYRQAISVGRFEQAEAGYRLALTSVELTSREHPETATIYRVLAELARARGCYADAESHARTALAIRKTALGAGSQAVAADSALLATLLTRRADYIEAEGLLRHALATFDATIGPESQEAADTAHALAAVLSAGRRFDEADALYRRALSTRRTILGGAHPDVAVTLHDWALLCDTTGHPEKARRLWVEADAVVTSTEHSTPNAEPTTTIDQGD